MSGYIAKLVGKKILGETLENKFGTEDPYFERVPATRLDGKPSGKHKKRKKALPPGISDHDAKVLTKVKRRAYRLDNALCNCCGVKFGWGSVIALLPAVGDVLDTLLALMVFRSASKIEGGLPGPLVLRMLLNIVFDFVVGIVPFIGDIADAAFRANTRNAALLESHLREKGKKTLRKSGLPLPDIDPSLGEEYDKFPRDDSELVSSQPGHHEEMNGNGREGAALREPEAARTRRDEASRGLSGMSRKPDVEMGLGERDQAPKSKSKSKSKQQRRP